MRWPLLAVACLLERASAVSRAWSERRAWGGAAPGGALDPQPPRASREGRDAELPLLEPAAPALPGSVARQQTDKRRRHRRGSAQLGDDIGEAPLPPVDGGDEAPPGAVAAPPIDGGDEAPGGAVAAPPIDGGDEAPGGAVAAPPVDGGDEAPPGAVATTTTATPLSIDGNDDGESSSIDPVVLPSEAAAGQTWIVLGAFGLFRLQMEHAAVVGSWLRITSGSVSELARIASFDSGASRVNLEAALAHTYPAGAEVVVTIAQAADPTPSPTMVVLDDPHVISLRGERFDIRMPTPECVLLRVPFRNEDPELLKLSASVKADGANECGLYVREVALSGSLLDHHVVRVRPHTRNAVGSNQAGNETMTHFSLQVGNSSWRAFSQAEGMGTDIPEASVGVLRAHFARREEFGQRVEAQSVELLVGRGSQTAVFTVSQAKHQALNLEIGRFGELGHRRVGGALGTEGRDAALEEPTVGCRRTKASASQRHKKGPRPGVPAAAPPPLSYISASWQ